MKILLYEPVKKQQKLSGFEDPDVLEWRGVTVLGKLEQRHHLDEQTLDLLRLAHDIAAETDDKTQLLLIGADIVPSARKLFAYGIDRIFVYDATGLENPNLEISTKILAHFIDNFKPAGVFFRSTKEGKALCGRVIEHAQSAGKTLETTPIALPLVTSSYDPDHRGELVICEIPF